MLVRTTLASSATRAVIVSLAGEAVTRLPATVARVRNWGAPTSAQAWASGSARATQSGEAMTSLWVASAPSLISSPAARTYLRSRRAAMSISVGVGRTPRESSTSTSVPPATRRAVPAYSSRSLSAPSRRVGCRYVSHIGRGNPSRWCVAAAQGGNGRHSVPRFNDRGDRCDAVNVRSNAYARKDLLREELELAGRIADGPEEQVLGAGLLVLQDAVGANIGRPDERGLLQRRGRATERRGQDVADDGCRFGRLRGQVEEQAGDGIGKVARILAGGTDIGLDRLPDRGELDGRGAHGRGDPAVAEPRGAPQARCRAPTADPDRWTARGEPRRQEGCFCQTG